MSLKSIHSFETRRLEIMERKIGKPQPWATTVASVIDILRTLAWFEHVRDFLQRNVDPKFKTPYAVGKFINPHTYRGASAGFAHDNLWAKYATGVHCPGTATLAAVEEKVPGATAVYDSPLWAMLNIANPVGNQVGDGLNRLRVGVQESLYNSKLLRFGMYQRRNVSQAMLCSLERQAVGLDSLAAVVLLLKEAHEASNHEQVFRIALSLHRILLMTCMSWPAVCYRAPLIAYFSLFVFPLAASDSLVIDVPIGEFYEMSFLLNTYMLILEDREVIRVETGGTTRELQRMLAGDLGMDLQYGFMPRLKVAPGCQDPHIAGKVASNNIGKNWGLAVLRRYGYVDFPPEEILLDMHAAYSASNHFTSTPGL